MANSSPLIPLHCPPGEFLALQQPATYQRRSYVRQQVIVGETN
jgi:hypothetical protein